MLLKRLLELEHEIMSVQELDKAAYLDRSFNSRSTFAPMFWPPSPANYIHILVKYDEGSIGSVAKRVLPTYTPIRHLRGSYDTVLQQSPRHLLEAVCICRKIVTQCRYMA